MPSGNPARTALYKATAALMRAYANIADELELAGYSAAKISSIKSDIDRYTKLREIIRLASGETLDLKPYEADMRHLIDTYIEADEPRKISPFDKIAAIGADREKRHCQSNQYPARGNEDKQ